MSELQTRPPASSPADHKQWIGARMGPDHRDPRFTGVLKFIYATAAIVGATALCGMYVKASNMSDDLIVLKTNQGNQNNQLSRVETEQLEQRRALDDVNRRLITLEARSNDARR